MSETRVDRHDQHLLDVLQDFLQHRSRGCRVDDHSCPFAQCLDSLHCAVQIGVTFPVNEKGIRAGIDKLARGRSPGPKSSGAFLEAGASPAGVIGRSALPSKDWARSAHPSRQCECGRLPALLRLSHLLAQAGKVSREDGRGKFNRYPCPYPKSLCSHNSRTVRVIRDRAIRFLCDSPIIACLRCWTPQRYSEWMHPAGR